MVGPGADACEILVALRRSFIVPVPGLLADRVLATAAADI